MKVRLLPSDVNPTEALIYLWEISDRGRVIYRYVGKAKEGAGRPLADYKRNVRNLLAGRSYRKGKKDFRTVHRRLARAVRLGRTITLRFLCNVAPTENINGVERRYHDHYVLGRRVRRGRGKFPWKIREQPKYVLGPARLEVDVYRAKKILDRAGRSARSAIHIPGRRF